MSTSLKDRAAKARSRKGKGKAKAPKAELNGSDATPESEVTTAEAEVPVTDTQVVEPVDTAGQVTPDNVTHISDAVVAGLSDDEVAAALASANQAADLEDSEPLTATLIATRETKADQVQYDGKTPEGYIIRVWAPAGTPMLIGATLATPA